MNNIQNNHIFPCNRLEPLFTQKCNLNCTYCFEKHKDGKNMNFDEFILYVRGDLFSLPSTNFYVFGGEPFLNSQFLEEFFNYIKSTKFWSIEEKNSIINSIGQGITTNGTLIKNYKDMLRTNGASLQVSLDGPEFINDKCRVDFSGKGHFKEILNNIKDLSAEGIPIIVHGALCKDNYKYLKDIVKFFLEFSLKNIKEPLDSIEDSKLLSLLNSNKYMTVIEDDLDDHDIDVYLNSFIEACEFLMKTDLLNPLDYNKRLIVLKGFLTHTGSTCAAGRQIMALTSDFKICPCHRTATESERYRIIYDVKNHKFIDYQIAWLYEIAGHNKFYSGYEISNRNNYLFFPHMNICFATNYKYTGELTHMPPKYTVLFKELQRLTMKLFEYFNLNSVNVKKDN